jgi:hypothetical protein
MFFPVVVPGCLHSTRHQHPRCDLKITSTQMCQGLTVNRGNDGVTIAYLHGKRLGLFKALLRVGAVSDSAVAFTAIVQGRQKLFSQTALPCCLHGALVQRECFGVAIQLLKAATALVDRGDLFAKVLVVACKRLEVSKGRYGIVKAATVPEQSKKIGVSIDRMIHPVRCPLKARDGSPYHQHRRIPLIRIA